jgi:hypothetical protein
VGSFGMHLLHKISLELLFVTVNDNKGYIHHKSVHISLLLIFQDILVADCILFYYYNDFTQFNLSKLDGEKQILHAFSCMQNLVFKKEQQEC